MYSKKYVLLFLIFILDFGTTKFKFRSIGGRDALAGEFPFVLRLGVIEINLNHRFFCSGSALTPTWGLTAAHCEGGYLDKKDEEKIIAVWYNPLDVSHMGESEILSIINHPRFHANGIGHCYNDIALFETKQTMNVVTFAKLSCLDYVSVDGLKAFGVGYGMRNVTESQITLQVVEGMLSRCGKEIKFAVTPSICLMPMCNVRNGGAALTPGDSGGPIVHASGIVGIASKSKHPDIPRKYLMPETVPLCIMNTIAPYLNWISNVISGTHNTS